MGTVLLTTFEGTQRDGSLDTGVKGTVLLTGAKGTVLGGRFSLTQGDG